MITVFEKPVHTEARLDTLILTDAGKVTEIKNLRWLRNQLSKRGVWARRVVVRERTKAERGIFRMADCVLEVHLSTGYKYSTMFASRDMLRKVLVKWHNLQGANINWFGTEHTLMYDIPGE